MLVTEPSAGTVMVDGYGFATSLSTISIAPGLL
jgi:hypothetical protein